MRLAVIGCGYVGLVTGSCLAEAGHDVIATDNDVARINTLNAGRLPIHEPGLDRVMERARAAGRLRFISDCAEAASAAEAIFICVGTPPLASGDADLSAIDNVAQQIAAASRSRRSWSSRKAPCRRRPASSCAASSTSMAAAPMARVSESPPIPSSSAKAPRSAISFIPIASSSASKMRSPSASCAKSTGPSWSAASTAPCTSRPVRKAARPAFLVTTIASAELIKHASNSFLGLKIAYANVLADLCERLGGDVEEVTRAMGMDPRIGPQFLNAGLGFGGFCLPKDIQAFNRLAERHGVDFTLLKETERINKRRIDQLMEKVRKALWVVKEKKIGVLGLAFKPNTDDVRFAPAIEVIRRLQAERAVVRATDPVAIEKARAVLPGVDFVEDAYQAACGADALLLLTEWPEYRKLDWKRICQGNGPSLGD